MRKCSVEETRKRMDFLKGSMCQKENAPLFDEALSLRRTLAELLSFPTFSDYMLEIRMAKNKDNVLK